MQSQCSTAEAFRWDDPHSDLCRSAGTLWTYCWYHSFFSCWSVKSRLEEDALLGGYLACCVPLRRIQFKLPVTGGGSLRWVVFFFFDLKVIVCGVIVQPD